MNWRDYFVYDPDSKTGLLWGYKKYTGDHGKTLSVWPGKVAGWISAYGYGNVKLLGKIYFTHRIIYEMCIGGIPEGYEVDHKNGNRLDNSLGNLRLVTPKENARNKKMRYNNKTGHTGVNKYVNKNHHYFLARWTNIHGKELSKSFSIKKYGEEAAFKMACDFRDEMVNALNEQGAGYTERHGNDR